jgi:hypothetical protein
MELINGFVLIHRAFLYYRQLPINAQTINKGINQPFIIIIIIITVTPDDGSSRAETYVGF